MSQTEKIEISLKFVLVNLFKAKSLIEAEFDGNFLKEKI
jgi:hypothetical protein